MKIRHKIVVDTRRNIATGRFTCDIVIKVAAWNA